MATPFGHNGSVVHTRRSVGSTYPLHTRSTPRWRVILDRIVLIVARFRFRLVDAGVKTAREGHRSAAEHGRAFEARARLRLVWTPMRLQRFTSARRMARRERPRDDIDGHIREIALRPARFGPPRRVRSDVSVSVRQRAGWTVYTFEPAASDARVNALYLHGGAWVHQIAKPHWRLVERIAAKGRTRVVVPLYPLIPFGTAAEVIPTVVDLATESSVDVLIGDSAGGQIALSAALALRDGGHTVSTVLISPALDIALRNPAIDSVDDPCIDRDSLREYGRWWQGELSDDDPRVSPLHADLAGLGPMTVFSGTRDILNPDARDLVAKAARSGVTVDYHEGHRLTHDYPLFPTTAGRKAQETIVENLRQTDRATVR